MLDVTAPANDQERWAHPNRLGSTALVSDASGAAVETHAYAPYGAPGAAGPGGFPYRFTGQRLDAESGLYFYKARYYDPELGRFLQTDPIGYADQMNLYAYVGNDPINATDPWGLEAWLVSRSVGGGLNHSFVVVADELGGEPRERFSYGPNRQRDGDLVSHSSSADQRTGTNRGDVAAWQVLAGSETGRANGVSALKINAPDPVVIAYGKGVDAGLGTIEAPAGVDYDMLPHGRNDGANSNSAAFAVANGAINHGMEAGAEWLQQPIPPGTSNPGWNQADRVPIDNDIVEGWMKVSEDWR